MERLEELGRYLVVALDGVGAAGKGTGGEKGALRRPDMVALACFGGGAGERGSLGGAGALRC